MTQFYAISVPYQGDVYEFILTPSAQVVAVTVSWGCESRVPEPIDVDDLPEGIDEALFNQLKKYDFWKS